MSLASWIEEFYPVAAENCPQAQALDHSILKWTGLLQENLEKHGVSINAGRCIADDTRDYTVLTIDGDSCALCRWHYDGKTGSCTFKNGGCPIYHVHGRYCDTEYAEFRRTSQVAPMLALLQSTKEAQNAPKG